MNSHSPHPTAARRIERIHYLFEQLSYKTYLEIGVFKGTTFLHLQVPHKVGVDPNFLFDIESVKNESTVLASMTSDEYFSTLPVGTQFDFIYLDGLHVFEQTYRDFCNAVNFTHPKSIIMIDDVLPNDEFSAIPDQQKCYQERQARGLTDQRWHGDVYKTVFALHDFHLGFDYCTMSDVGNPQMLVWRSDEFKRQPKFNSLQTISQLTYAQMQAHISMMRIDSEENALHRCLQTLKPKI